MHWETEAVAFAGVSHLAVNLESKDINSLANSCNAIRQLQNTTPAFN